MQEEVRSRSKVTLNWRTDLGTMKRGVFKVGPVKFEDRRGQTAEDRRMYVHSRHVDLGAHESDENRKLVRF